MALKDLSTIAVVSDWSKGMRDNYAFEHAPPGTAYLIDDFLVDQPGMLYKRGGWLYASSTQTGSTYGKLAEYCEDFALPVCIIGSNDHLFVSAYGSGAATTDKGAVTVVPYSMTYRVGGGKNLLIIAGTGAVPRKYDGTTLAALGGSPPSGCKFCDVYKTRLVLANNSATPQRLFFSPTPDIEATWDTTNSWLDADHAVTGLAALQNVFLIFTANHTERLTGANPPTVSDSGDFDHGRVGDVGLTDSRSICIWNNNAIFANAKSVYMTNGVGFRDLLDEGGIRSGNFLGSSGGSSFTSCGVWGNFLFVTGGTLGSAPSAQGNLSGNTMICYLPTVSWVRANNIGASDYARLNQAFLIASISNTNRAMDVSVIPGYGNSGDVNDGDATAILPNVIVNPIAPYTGLNHYGLAWLDYRLNDPSTLNPTLGIQMGRGFMFDGQDQKVPPESPLPETSAAESDATKRFTAARVSKALHMLIQQNNGSSFTDIHFLKVQVRPFYPTNISGQS